MTTRPLPQPVSPTDKWLAAVVDRLDALISAVEELSGRLGPSTQPPPGQEQEATLRLLEPDAGPTTEPMRLREPDIPPEPPRHGKGSGRPEWADYALDLGVNVTLDMKQRDIIAAVDAWKAAA